MNAVIKQVKDLKILLKDLERFIKAPDFLRTGRNFTNFSLRPREVLVNWLVCAILKYRTGRDFTFGEDPQGGDGIIIDKTNAGEYVLTEHIFIPHLVGGDMDQAVVDAVNKKSAIGKEYAKDRWLFVFSEKVGEVHPSNIRRSIRENKIFNIIYLIALEKSSDDGYIYWVTPLRTARETLEVYKIYIKPTFDGWHVELFEVLRNSYGHN